MKSDYLHLYGINNDLHSHTNIIGYEGAFFEDKTQSLCIIMEYANGGDLLQMINNCIKNRVRLPETEIWRYFVGMVLGLKALHTLKICHRDIKCANMFISKGQIKIGDLNVSKIAKYGLLRTQAGTPYYASPEVWKDLPYNDKSDIWSLGCVLYEMCELHPPFRAKNMAELYKKIITGKYKDISKHYSADLSRMVRRLLQLNPSVRPTCSNIW